MTVYRIHQRLTRQTRSCGQKIKHYALDQTDRGNRIEYDEHGTAHAVEDKDPKPMALIATINYSICFEESIDYENAQQSPEWRAAMEDEIQRLKKNETWVLRKLPPGERAFPNKWIFKIKHSPDGNVTRYRVRLA